MVICIRYKIPFSLKSIKGARVHYFFRGRKRVRAKRAKWEGE